MEAMVQPSVSVAVVSNRHGVSRSLLFEWLRQTCDGTMPGMAGQQAPGPLVLVRVVADAPRGRRPARTGSPHGCAVQRRSLRWC